MSPESGGKSHRRLQATALPDDYGRFRYIRWYPCVSQKRRMPTLFRGQPFRNPFRLFPESQRFYVTPAVGNRSPKAVHGSALLQEQAPDLPQGSIFLHFPPHWSPAALFRLFGPDAPAHAMQYALRIPHTESSAPD